MPCHYCARLTITANVATSAQPAVCTSCHQANKRYLKARAHEERDAAWTSGREISVRSTGASLTG